MGNRQGKDDDVDEDVTRKDEDEGKDPPLPDVREDDNHEKVTPYT